MDGNYQQIAVSLLRESALNNRTDFGDMTALTDSVRQSGVRTPLLVRPVDGGYEIAAGHRRGRAAQAAELETVPAVVREMTDEEFAELLTFENLEREDLNALAEAQGYRMLMDRFGYTVERIAERLGGRTKRAQVYARLKLLDLIEPAKEMLASGEISPGHAILIARAQPKDQKRALKWMADQAKYNQTISVKFLGQWIQQHTQLDLAEAAFPINDGVLLPRAGSCELCPKRAGSNLDLFPDTPANTCTDGECYDRKVDAFVERRKAELAAQGEFIQIADTWGSNTPSVIGARDYEPADPDAKGPNVKTALIVQGADIGTVTKVRLHEKASSCDLTENDEDDAFVPRDLAKEAADRAKAEEKRRQEDETRRRVLVAIVGKVKAPLGRAELIKFAAVASESVNEEELDALCKITGVPEVAKNTQYDIALAKSLAKISDDVLAKFIVGARLAEYALASWSNGKPLFDAAADYKVDPKKIRDQVAEEAKAAKKAEAKPAAGAAKPEAKKTAKPAAKAAAKPAAKKKAKKK